MSAHIERNSRTPLEFLLLLQRDAISCSLLHISFDVKPITLYTFVISLQICWLQSHYLHLYAAPHCATVSPLSKQGLSFSQDLQDTCRSSHLRLKLVLILSSTLPQLWQAGHWCLCQCIITLISIKVLCDTQCKGYIECGTSGFFWTRAQFFFCGGKHSAQVIQFYLNRLSDPVHRNRWGQGRMKDSPTLLMLPCALKWQLSYAIFKP